MSDKTNGAWVREWMQRLGQSTPSAPCNPGEEIVRLRANLVHEEAMEAVDELQHGYARENGQNIPNLSASAKELADVLVVTYGGLVALGFEPDEVFQIVMDENEAKVAHAEDRGDGKRVVPEDVKQRLKERTRERLQALVSG